MVRNFYYLKKNNQKIHFFIFDFSSKLNSTAKIRAAYFFWDLFDQWKVENRVSWNTLVASNETFAKVKFKISPVILLDEPQYWVRASSLFCPADFYPVLSFEDQQMRQPLFDEQDQVFWWMIWYFKSDSDFWLFQ